MDIFEDCVSKRERRHVKHGLVDVPTRHSSQRSKERRNVPTRPITVCAGGKRVVVTHTLTKPRCEAVPVPCKFVHVLTSSHSPGKIIGRNGHNVRCLQGGDVFVRIQSNERDGGASGARCVVEGNDQVRVLETLERLKALLQSL
tara:strand:- start:1574 stop:2005 length:432 start_codon:yes stop_codon:yes gene_type:complete